MHKQVQPPLPPPPHTHTHLPPQEWKKYSGQLSSVVLTKDLKRIRCTELVSVTSSLKYVTPSRLHHSFWFCMPAQGSVFYCKRQKPCVCVCVCVCCSVGHTSLAVHVPADAVGAHHHVQTHHGPQVSGHSGGKRGAWDPLHSLSKVQPWNLPLLKVVNA